MPIQNKQDLLLNSLLKYYEKQSNLKKVVDILEKKSKVSLRIVDYLCTNYAKQHDVVYYIGNRKTPFNLYLDYRSQLKAYSKMQFDPFKRHQRITINVPTSIKQEGKLETTVAQLNFFKWAIDNKVLEYLDDHKNMEKIDKNMNQTQVKKKQPESKSKKTNVFTTTTKRQNLQVTVTFQ